ncbi:hypothetical protein ABMA46_00525 [Mesorhizobium sp. CN5-321]|jgi:tetratricopeptide (TPR) repeat protein|uniref:hypothetical protein n=1 Tax=Mesorhizobium hunchu TaxID=3157708 RepID=UPI0032B72C57
MRIVFAVLATSFLSVSLAPSALAAGPAARDVAPPQATPGTRAERLDKLFADLKRERNEKAAERIANQIYMVWNDSGSASVDLMMQWAQKAIQDQKFDVAMDFLDEVVTLQPDFVEGWNRRATVNFLMKNYAKSMADIDRVLELEPRHFGALSGLAQIMADTGRKEQALKAWQRVLDIYPMLRNAQQQVSTLSEDLAGESI